MSIAVQHDPPSQRLNYRISAPITIFIGGDAYQTVNWSASDFVLRNYAGTLRENEVFFVQINIPFQGFDVSFKAQARVKDIDVTEHTILCEFMNLDNRAQNILKTFVSGLMSGEMEEIDGIIRRLDVPVTPASLKPDAPVTPEAQAAEQERRQKVTMGYMIASLVLGLILTTLIYTNLFQMTTESAVIVAETDMLLAPATGDVDYMTPEINVGLKSGDPILSFIDPKLEQNIKLAELRVNESKLAMSDTRGANGENSRIAQELDAANARMRSLENKLRVQRASVNRNRSLLADGLASRRMLEIAEAEYYDVEGDFNEARQKTGQLQATLSSADQLNIIAQNELEMLKEQRKRLVLRAPTDGQVVKLNVSPNASVRFGQLLGLYERASNRHIEAFLTREESLHVALDDEVDVYFPSVREDVPHRVTHIDYVSRAMDEKSGELAWQWSPDERTVTVTLEPLDDNAAAFTRAITPGSTAIVMFSKNPFRALFN